MTNFRRAIAVVLIFAFTAAAPPAFAAWAYRAYVPNAWGQVHVRVEGEGNGPTVIMLHKMVWSSVEFRKVQPLLAAAGIRTIAADIPGYGLSDAPPREPTATEYAEQTLSPILAHFKLAKAHVLGIDSGATIVAAFAEVHPGQVESLLLDNPPLFDKAALVELLKEKEFDRTPKPDAAEFTRRWREMVQMAGAGPTGQSPEAVQQGIIEFFTAAPTYLYGHHAIFKHDIARSLRAVKMPTLVMASGSGVRIDKNADVMKLRPDFTYVDLTWPGVHPVWDAPQPWADVVIAFVRKH